MPQARAASPSRRVVAGLRPGGMPVSKEEQAPPLSPNPSCLHTSSSVHVPPYFTGNPRRTQELSARDPSPSSRVPPSPTRHAPGQLPRFHTSSPQRGRSTAGSGGLPATGSTISIPGSPGRSAALSPQRSRAYSPVRRLPMPPKLNFESWWMERGQRMSVLVEFDTATRVCNASLHTAGSVDARVTSRHSQVPAEPWDLHVGAQLALLGRTVTLRKARDQATVDWLDQQAQLLRAQCTQLREALVKYRPVSMVGPGSPGPGAATGMRAPACGGHTNLRSLYTEVVSLAKALRQHQASLPPLVAPDGTALPATQLGGPPDWSPGRALAASKAQQEEEEAARRAAAEAAAAEGAKTTRDTFEWLVQIPLAASAAALKGGTATAEVSAATAAPAPTPSAAQRINARASHMLTLDLPPPAPGMASAGSESGAALQPHPSAAHSHPHDHAAMALPAALQPTVSWGKGGAAVSAPGSASGREGGAAPVSAAPAGTISKQGSMAAQPTNAAHQNGDVSMSMLQAGNGSGPLAVAPLLTATAALQAAAAAAAGSDGCPPRGVQQLHAVQEEGSEQASISQNSSTGDNHSHSMHREAQMGHGEEEQQGKEAGYGDEEDAREGGEPSSAEHDAQHDARHHQATMPLQQGGSVGGEGEEEEYEWDAPRQEAGDQQEGEEPLSLLECA